MELQTLTFSITGMTPGQGFSFVESFRLGLSEFEGITGNATSRRAHDGSFVVFANWDSDKSLQQFRHSEAYARMMLSPHIADLHDHVESVCSLAELADETRATIAA